MDIEQAIETIYTGLVSEESVPVKLRAFRELDREMLGQVQEALSFAMAMVDIFGAFCFNSGFSEKELRELEDIGMKLQEQALELFDE